MQKTLTKPSTSNSYFHRQWRPMEAYLWWLILTKIYFVLLIRIMFLILRFLNQKFSNFTITSKICSQNSYKSTANQRNEQKGRFKETNNNPVGETNRIGPQKKVVGTNSFPFFLLLLRLLACF